MLEALPLARDPGRAPLFGVFFNLLPFAPPELEAAGVRVEEVETADLGSKFDLTVYARERGEGLLLDWVYNAELFTAGRAASMA